jgi:hypothetical protein
MSELVNIQLQLDRYTFRMSTGVAAAGTDQKFLVSFRSYAASVVTEKSAESLMIII